MIHVTKWKALCVLTPSPPPKKENPQKNLKQRKYLKVKNLKGLLSKMLKIGEMLNMLKTWGGLTPSRPSRNQQGTTSSTFPVYLHQPWRSFRVVMSDSLFCHRCALECASGNHLFLIYLHGFHARYPTMPPPKVLAVKPACTAHCAPAPKCACPWMW